MATIVTIKLPQGVVERLSRGARRQGLGLEEYILELILRELDPPERAREYIEAARSLLEQAREELEKNRVRQAAEKAWGAAALAVKAYMEWSEGRRLSSHGELWEAMRRMTGVLGAWVRDAWMYANGMHTCFYEGWCSKEDVEEALKKIERLVDEVAARVKT